MGLWDVVRPFFSGGSVPLVLLAIVYATFILPYQNKLVSSSAIPYEKDSQKCSISKQGHFILFSTRVVTPDGVISAAIEVKNGKIAAITEQAVVPRANGLPVQDYSGAVISPGLVDVHVHLNEPGRTDWEGFVTGTRAAAAGGVTTLVEMPLNSEPTTVTKAALDLKLKAAKGKLMVDTAFWGGLVPENAFDSEELEALFKAGVVGLKAFMCPSGINDFPATNVSHFEAALPVIAQYKGVLLVHSELQSTFEASGDPRKYATYLATRPPSLERAAIEQLVELSRHTAKGGKWEGARIHIVHLADADSIPLIKAAQEAGGALSAEACPHYLSFNAADVPDGATQYKCAPPIRDLANQQKLWQGLKDGVIHFMTSDHSPSLPSLKMLDTGDFLKAWGGIAGLQFDLMASWKAGLSYGITLEKMALWWSARPAEFAKLTNKGGIVVGKDADFVVWQPEAPVSIDQNFTIFHKHKVTPYAGLTLAGQIYSTYVRGNLVFAEGVHAEKACGQKLLLKVEEAISIL